MGLNENPVEKGRMNKQFGGELGRKLNYQGRAIFQEKENGGSIEGSCQEAEMKTEYRFCDLAKNRPLKILA